MQIGVIADDFTGASDIANTLAKGGLATTLHLGLPRRAADPATEAGVVALKTRSIPPADAVEQSLAALAWLQAQGCWQIVFKVCSTFDSTPRGNIGPVSEALARALEVGGVAVCPAFPATGRTVYQGHLFVGDRLLNESGLERHPLNPMTDPDLRRWLARQSNDPVGHVPWSVVRRGAGAIRAALHEAAQAGHRHAIVDAIADEDLVALGEACADAPLLTGGSGIALGLPRNLIRAGLASGRASGFQGVNGPAAILAGSCSRATLEQIVTHVREHPSLAVDVEAVMDGTLEADDLVAFVMSYPDAAPLVFSSAPPATVAALQERHGRDAVAERLDELFGETARRLVAHGITRLVVAGGETSGAVVSALGLESVVLGPEIDPGVPALADLNLPLALALKSGNFGAPDFFAKALRVMADHA